MASTSDPEPLESSTIVRTQSDGLTDYPWELVRPLTLPDGGRLLLRPVRPADEPRLATLFERLSPRTAHQRFLSPFRRLPSAWYRHFANVDYDTRLALVAEDQHAPESALRAHACLESDETPGTAEIAIVVEDAWQGRGLGKAMLAALLAAAEARGIHRFTADLLADNHRMLHLLWSLCAVRRRELYRGVLTLELERRPALATVSA